MNNSRTRERSKSTDRPKSDLFKKVEMIEKKMEKVDEILEMLKKNPLNIKYVEEEIVINV